MAEILKFTGDTRLDVPVADVINGATDLTSIVIVGTDKYGDLYFASSTGDEGEILLLFERAKRVLMDYD